MAVTLHTTAGDIKIELFCEACPKACENFLALCASDYYKDNIFHRNIKDFMVQTGDPTGTGKGGNSIWGAPFEDELSPDLKHDTRGVLSMANNGPNTNKSQFFISYDKQPHLDLKYTVFGKVIDGFDALDELESIKVDAKYRPVVEQRIRAFSTDPSVSEKIRKMQEYFDQYADEYVEEDDVEVVEEAVEVLFVESIPSVETIDQIVSLLADQRAKDVVVLDNLRDGTSIIDSLIICSPFNSRHGAAIAETLRRASKSADVLVSKRSLRNTSGWFQVDIGGIQVNVMSDDIRLRYDLEGLWGAGDEQSEPELPLIPPPRPT